MPGEISRVNAEGLLVSSLICGGYLSEDGCIVISVEVI